MRIIIISNAAWQGRRWGRRAVLASSNGGRRQPAGAAAGTAFRNPRTGESLNAYARTSPRSGPGREIASCAAPTPCVRGWLPGGAAGRSERVEDGRRCSQILRMTVGRFRLGVHATGMRRKVHPPVRRASACEGFGPIPSASARSRSRIGGGHAEHRTMPPVCRRSVRCPGQQHTP
jgi:hypothetical protein